MPASNFEPETAYDPQRILADSQPLNAGILSRICAELRSLKTQRQAVSALAAILLVRPEFAKFLPQDVLPEPFDPQSGASIWQSLALLMLHSERQQYAAAWLQNTFELGTVTGTKAELFQHLLDWFPDEILPERITKFEAVEASARKVAARQLEYIKLNEPEAVCPSESILAGILSGNSNVLVIHNIVYGQGDELVRVFPLVQGLLDAFPDLSISLLTDRQFLYNHSRVRTFSINDTAALSKLLEQEWTGVINFFEPYLDSSSYNLEAEKLICQFLKDMSPPFQVIARRDINHFVFESVIIGGAEYADKWSLRERELSLSYETCMRLITHLGLPLRTGEMKPAAGWLAAARPCPLAESYLRALLPSSPEHSSGRLLAVVNAFGGNNAMKGFQRPNYPRLASVLCQFASQGYDLVLLGSSEIWGAAEQLHAIRNLVDDAQRRHIYLLPASSEPAATMRAVMHFVSAADLVITVEGWLMHLAYALGKQYYLFMAPYSYSGEWHPLGRSARQGSFLSGAERAFRSEFVSAEHFQLQLLHYPEKSLFKAALNIWSRTADRALVEQLSPWSRSADKDIRSWILNLQACLDPVFFLEKLLAHLNDTNREVRGAAASGLQQSGQDLSGHLGVDWKEQLWAHRLLTEFRFQDLRPLGKSACPALKACLEGDESEVSRDAAVMLEVLHCR